MTGFFDRVFRHLYCPFVISLICVISCFKMAIIRMIIVISVCRGVSGLGCSFFGFPGSTVSLLCPILGLASCWLVLLFFLPSFFLFALLCKVYPVTKLYEVFRGNLHWLYSLTKYSLLQ